MMENFAFYRHITTWSLLLCTLFSCNDVGKTRENPVEQENIEIHTSSVYADRMASTFQDYRFPLYPNIIRMHGEKIYYQHQDCFSWEAFACFSPPTQVIDYYREKLGEKSFTAIEKGGMWRIVEMQENNTRKIIRMLQVIAPNNHDLPGCYLPEQTKSIILIAINITKITKHSSTDKKISGFLH